MKLHPDVRRSGRWERAGDAWTRSLNGRVADVWCGDDGRWRYAITDAKENTRVSTTTYADARDAKKRAGMAL